MSPEDVQRIIANSPYLSWLGLNVIELDDDSIGVTAKWREEWVANAQIGQTQGGILAALLDFAGDGALVSRMGRLVPTIDMRIDYHRMAKKGDLIARGRIVKLGKQFSVCDAQLFGEDSAMIASSRGVYLTAQTNS